MSKKNEKKACFVDQKNSFWKMIFCGKMCLSSKIMFLILWFTSYSVWIVVWPHIIRQSNVSEFVYAKKWGQIFGDKKAFFGKRQP